MTSIEYQGVTLKLGDRVALDNIDLQFEYDHIVGLICRSRREPTILLSMLPSLRYPSEGSITVDGEDVYENSYVMSKISFTWADQIIHNSRSIKDALKFSAALRPNWDMGYAFSLIKLFRLHPHMTIKKMNSENKAIFNVICTLASRAPITILAGTYLKISEEKKAILFKEIQDDHRRFPRIIILSTNNAAEIESFIHDAVILDEGKIIAHEAPGVITASAQEIMKTDTRPTLQEVFLHFTKEGGTDSVQ